MTAFYTGSDPLQPSWNNTLIMVKPTKIFNINYFLNITPTIELTLVYSNINELSSHLGSITLKIRREVSYIFKVDQ